MAGVRERTRTDIKPRELAAKAIQTMQSWGHSEEDILWSIQKGAKRANDKRCKALRAATRMGGSEICPFEDDWTVRGSASVLESLNYMEEILAERMFEAVGRR